MAQVAHSRRPPIGPSAPSAVPCAFRRSWRVGMHDSMMMSGLQDAEFALPEVESKHEADPIISASSRDPFRVADRSVCDGTAAADSERCGPQASHEGLPIQSSKTTQRQPHRRAPKPIAWRPAQSLGRSVTPAYVSDSESLALFAG